MSSFIGGGQNFLSGHAVIPVSVPGLILIAANLVIFLVFIINVSSVMSSWRNKFFVLSYIALIAAKIGGKIRNFVSTSALLGAFTADVSSRIRNRKLKAALICMYLTGTIWGMHNVIFHTDTAKGSWNTPYGEVIEFLEDYDADRKYPVIAFDAVLNYHAENHGYKVIRAEKHQEWQSKVKNLADTVIVAKTFRGSLSEKEFADFNSYINSRNVIHEKKFGYDKFAGFKRLFDKECPDYYVVLLVTE